MEPLYIKNDSGDVTYNYPRVVVLQTLFSGQSSGSGGLFPVIGISSHALSIDDVKQGLRNHYQGTANDPYETQSNPPDRPISIMRTAFSHITQLRASLPPAIGNIEYIAMGMADLSIYIPFYQGLTTIPSEYQSVTDGVVDSNSVYWKYRKLQALVLQNYPKYAPQAHTMINPRFRSWHSSCRAQTT